MKLNFDNPGEEARIEILPLIDVIFCILTFFILGAVSLTRQSAIGVDLPGASTGTPQMREMMLVSLDPIGQLYYEQAPVSREQLSELLIRERQENPRKLVVLYASRSARYDTVVDVLDLLRTIGGDRVALATLPESSDQNGFDPTDPTQFDLENGGDFEFSEPELLEPELLEPGLLPDDTSEPDSSLFDPSSPAPANGGENGADGESDGGDADTSGLSIDDVLPSTSIDD